MGHVGGYLSPLRIHPIDFEESTHETSKHHADVVEYEEDTNPGGGQVTTESNLVEFDEEIRRSYCNWRSERPYNS